MTKSQEKIIQKIKENFYNVEVNETDLNIVFVKFDNGKDHIFLNESAHITIGKRGKVTFLSLFRTCSDTKHCKVLAHLMGTKLGLGSNQIHFSKMF